MLSVRNYLNYNVLTISKQCIDNINLTQFARFELVSLILNYMLCKISFNELPI